MTFDVRFKVHPISGKICVDCGREAFTIMHEYTFSENEIEERVRQLNGSWRSSARVYVRCREMAVFEVTES
jgi:hypothetical protein